MATDPTTTPASEPAPTPALTPGLAAGTPVPAPSEASAGGARRRGLTPFPPIVTKATPPKDPITSDTALIDYMLAAYTEVGSPRTAKAYATYALAFQQVLQSRGYTFATMPAGTMQEWLLQTFTPYTSHNAAMAGLRALQSTAEHVHYPFAAQTMTPRQKPKEPPMPASQPSLSPEVPPLAGPPPNGAVAVGPQAPDLGFIHGTSQGSADAANARATGQPPPPNAPVVTSDPTPPQPALAGSPTVAPPLARPAGVQRPPNGSHTKVVPVLPSLGGRVRISKRIDGYEGTGAPIGTRAVCGDYTLEDVEVEGSVMKFILNALRPHYGPKVGQTAATYYVERLDNLGNPIPGSLQAVPVFPDVAMGGMGTMGASTAPAPPSPPAPAERPMSVDREDTFIRYLMEKQAKAEERYERLLGEVQARKDSGGSIDPALLFMIQQAKPEPLDIDAAVARFRKVREESAAPPPPAPLPSTGLAGLDALMSPLPTREDKVVEALLGQVRDLTTQVRDLATRAATPPPQPSQRDPLEIVTTFAAAMKAFQPPPDPLREAMLKKLVDETGKTKTLSETLADLRAVQTFVGGEGGVPWGEIIATAVENLPQILGSIGAMKAPQIPRRRAPAPAPGAPAQPAQAQPAPQPASPPRLPEEGQKAFFALAKIPPGEEHDQEVVETVYALLQVLAKSGEPWNLIAKRVVETFLKLDTKAEIRAILTNLFVWCGAARRFMTDALLDRITDVFHANYTLIYGAMTGGQTRSLKDTPTGDAVPAPEGLGPTASEGEAVGAAAEVCEECGHPAHGDAACGYCKPTAACSRPAEDEDEDEVEKVEKAEEPQPQE